MIPIVNLCYTARRNMLSAMELYSRIKLMTRQPQFVNGENTDRRQHCDVDLASGFNLIEKAFLDGRPRWMEEPVISRWANPSSKVSKTLREVNTLLQQWTKSASGPFYPFSDPLWLQTAELLRDAGLPWHNNNLNLPDEIDPSWPFHFKEFERQAVLSKGARVGDRNPSGYVCSWSEANHYAIRALQQELRRQRPTQKPLLVSNRIESAMVQSAAQQFGLELFQVYDDWEAAEIELVQRTGGRRPIIFAATLADDNGRGDDFTAIDRLSKLLPMFLHVDASRTFDYITTVSDSVRQRLGIPDLLLCHPYLDGSATRVMENRTIRAATIVAAGMNCIYPPPVVALKPRSLGDPHSRRVEYVRGTDSTLAGSRDALGPLLVYLQEARFGLNGMREIYENCEFRRRELCELLTEHNIPVEIPRVSLDIIVRPRSIPELRLRRQWGLVLLKDGAILITVQPSVTGNHLEGLVQLFSATSISKEHTLAQYPSCPSQYPLPFAKIEPLIRRVAAWRILARSSSGYPLNQAPYSALGPIIGQFLPIRMDSDWIALHGSEILKERKSSFGLSPDEQDSFTANFTTGSTMGNRIGLHTALAQHPGAFVYFSTATHYSIKKIVLDSDVLTSRWTQRRTPRFAEIMANDLGVMIPQELAKQALKDSALCNENDECHQVILLANIGTTFVAGRDDILALRQCLRAIGSEISYIHVDGALDFGFCSDIVALGSPDTVTKRGLPAVQGITLSHHKAYGIMVSGEVICYTPRSKKTAIFASPVDPRIVFETWLFQQMYSAEDLAHTARYCVDNANRLRTKLASIGVATRFNQDSFTTLVERLPPWMIQDFHLAPEGDWVHYIAMPHITPGAIDHFVETVRKLDEHFATVFHFVNPDLELACGQTLSLQRIRCRDEETLPRVLNFLRKSYDGHDAFCLDTFKRRYTYGAMSFAAFDAQGDTCIIFLAETSAKRDFFPGPVIVTPRLSASNDTIQQIASKAFSLLSILLDPLGAGLDLRI